MRELQALYEEDAHCPEVCFIQEALQDSQDREKLMDSIEKIQEAALVAASLGLDPSIVASPSPDDKIEASFVKTAVSKVT